VVHRLQPHFTIGEPIAQTRQELRETRRRFLRRGRLRVLVRQLAREYADRRRLAATMTDAGRADPASARIVHDFVGNPTSQLLQQPA
jgi:hypothetical protein